MERAVSIIAAACEEMNSSGFAHTPRIAKKADFDLSKFSQQKSDLPDCDVEFVNQSGPGFSGDDFSGTIAWPISPDLLFVVDYYN